MTMLDNFCLKTDSYKLSHYRQYPPGTTNVYSYFESRKGARFDETVFFGLQYLLKRHFVGDRVTREDVTEAARFAAVHLGNDQVFHREGWERLVTRHGGRLPLRIRAVREGTPVPVSNVLMTVEATDPDAYWLTNYAETLLCQVWYPSTVATLSREAKKVLGRYLEETGTPADLPFKLHDFGFRGVSSLEQAGLGGMAHLVNFMGTDTIAGILHAMEYYGAEPCGFSVPATEHSTMTSWGEQQEAECYAATLDAYPQGIVSVVSDSWDIERAVLQVWGEALREKVRGRDGVTVIRLDSGDPREEVPLRVQQLCDKFGCDRNEKGFRVLPPYLRVLQGDGMNLDSLTEVCEELKKAGLSLDNVATFGMGGGLLQKIDRDTQRFAFKCSAQESDGGWRDVQKKVRSDPSKASKPGRLALIEGPSGLETVRLEEAPEGEDLLELVFENGTLVRDQTWEDVRQAAS